MIKLTELNKPRIDIEMIGMDTNIPPIDKVHIMDEDSFEQFTVEWLYGCKKDNYSSIKSIGGAGDKGRDVIAYYDNGSVDYYQCKHYDKPLAPSNYYLELGKLCYYTYIKDIPIPNNYYIIASHDVGSSLQDLIDKPTKLKEQLIDNWDKCCKSKITSLKDIALDEEILKYIDDFDFSIVKTYPIAKIIDEYWNTKYGYARFGGHQVPAPEPVFYEEILEDELVYIYALLEAYSEELNMPIESVDALEVHKHYFDHFKRQRKDYYFAETIRRFVRDTFTDSKQFDVLKDEVFDGIIDTHEKEYDNGFKRLNAVLDKATNTNTSKSLLDSKLNYIGNKERKGVCHILANDKRLKWVDDE